MVTRDKWIAFVFLLSWFASSSGVVEAQVQQRLSDQRASVSVLQPQPAGPPRSADTLVICPPIFQNAMRVWVRYRESQGHRIRMMAPYPSAYENRVAIRQLAQSGDLKTVVLVGDSGDESSQRDRMVPTDFIKAKVNVKFGSDPEIATDNTFADIDEDGLPELALGRIPVDTVEELENAIRRIIRYEQSTKDQQWQRRVNLIAGVGGFGQFIDKLIEQTTKQLVTDLIPASYRTSMTYGSWRSPYCPDPRKFSQTAIERFNEGCLFWVYLGHGNRHRLDKIYLPDQSHQILDVDTCCHIDAREGNPIAVFLACYTGAMDDEQDCISEEMFNRPNGPVAVIAGSRVTMPYAMGLFSLEMLQEYFGGDVETLGELIRLSKVKMASEPKQKSNYRSMIEAMGRLFSPQPELLLEERREHVHLMHLIGDPLLRLKRPEKLVVESPSKANAGSTIAVKGSVEEETQLNVEISYRRDRYRFRPPHRSEYQSSNSDFEAYQDAYEKARHLVCFRGICTVEKGDFTIEVPIPEDANGDCILSIYSTGSENLRIGSQPIFIRPNRTKTRTASLRPLGAPPQQ